jgi:hypothetical protein
MASEKPRLSLDDLDGVSLTAGQAFVAMGKFLDAYCQRTAGEGAIAIICSDVEIEDDGGSKDPAALTDWAECVSKVVASD